MCRDCSRNLWTSFRCNLLEPRSSDRLNSTSCINRAPRVFRSVFTILCCHISVVFISINPSRVFISEETFVYVYQILVNPVQLDCNTHHICWINDAEVEFSVSPQQHSSKEWTDVLCLSSNLPVYLTLSISLPCLTLSVPLSRSYLSLAFS